MTSSQNWSDTSVGHFRGASALRAMEPRPRTFNCMRMPSREISLAAIDDRRSHGVLQGCACDRGHARRELRGLSSFSHSRDYLRRHFDHGELVSESTAIWKSVSRAEAMQARAARNQLGALGSLPKPLICPTTAN